MKKEAELPLVSAIIVTHNRLSLLTRALDSTFAQSYQNIERIVVIDGSADGTLEYCQSRDDFRTIYIPPEESRGGNHARNLGILAAKGEYVALLDDDDYWLPTKIERQLEMALEKKCDIVYCRSRIERISKDGEVSWQDFPLNKENQGDMSQVILHSFVFLTSQVFFKRDTRIDVGLFDENLRFMQDYELSIRLAQRSHFHYVDDFLSVYRVNNYDPARLSNQFLPWCKAVLYIFRKHRKLYASMPLREQAACLKLFGADAYYRAKKTVKQYIFL